MFQVQRTKQTVMLDTKTSVGLLSRRRVALIFVLIGILIVIYIAKQKYLYASDCLKPVAKLDQFVRTSVLGKVPWGGGGGQQQQQQQQHAVNPWDAWMALNPHLSSIGDIYDKCDNATRKKTGKVVLEVSAGGGVHVTSYMNMTYDHDIVTSSAHVDVFYEGELLYEKDYDMCEAALKLDTPYSCPVPKGKVLVVRDVANMPGYIPKGSYRISGWVKDQHENFIGCTMAEFKTGEKPL